MPLCAEKGRTLSSSPEGSRTHSILLPSRTERELKGQGASPALHQQMVLSCRPSTVSPSGLSCGHPHLLKDTLHPPAFPDIPVPGHGAASGDASRVTCIVAPQGACTTLHTRCLAAGAPTPGFLYMCHVFRLAHSERVNICTSERVDGSNTGAAEAKLTTDF